MQRENKILDYQIERVNQDLKSLYDHTNYSKFSYISVDDIRALEPMKGESLIVITAPSGTTLEVPDPDQGMEEGKRRYQIYLHSSNGPISVWVLDQMDNNVPNNNLLLLDDQYQGLNPNANVMGNVDDITQYSNLHYNNQNVMWNGDYFPQLTDGPIDPNNVNYTNNFDDLPTELIGQGNIHHHHPPDGDEEFYTSLDTIGISDYYSEELVMNMNFDSTPNDTPK